MVRLVPLACRAGLGIQDPSAPSERKEPWVTKASWAQQAMTGSRVPWVYQAPLVHQDLQETMGTRETWENRDKRAAKATKENRVPRGPWESRAR